MMVNCLYFAYPFAFSTLYASLDFTGKTSWCFCTCFFCAVSYGYLIEILDSFFDGSFGHFYAIWTGKSCGKVSHFWISKFFWFLSCMYLVYLFTLEKTVYVFGSPITSSNCIYNICWPCWNIATCKNTFNICRIGEGVNLNGAIFLKCQTNSFSKRGLKCLA